MRRVFAHAGIEYGRLDFGMSADGRLQAWEINTNPGFIRSADSYPKELLSNSQYVGDEFEAALRSLDVSSSGPPIEIPWIPPAHAGGGWVTTRRRIPGRHRLRGLLRMPGLRAWSRTVVGRRLYERAAATQPR